MSEKFKFTKITPNIWEISSDSREDMRVPARLYASSAMLESAFADKTIEQLVNVSTLPGIVGNSLAMPDAHEGYGFPIGGVAATAWPDGVISPGGIGYDINCGVRLLTSNVSYSDVKHRIEKLAQTTHRNVPSGVGRGGQLQLSFGELDSVLSTGVSWAIKNGYATVTDADHTESRGVLSDADPGCVSPRAKQRGKGQLGTMGAGNHFVEIDRVDEVFDTNIAQTLGIFEGQITFQIHTGSRGLGHQVATDAIREMGAAMKRYGIKIPDRELACAPFSSPEGKSYFKGMCAAANFAWTNRQIITWEIRKAWEEIFGEDSTGLRVMYDVAHNIAKIETHEIDGRARKVIVHRKGATRAFPAGHPETPLLYRDCGQPVLIPGSMGTASYVLVGADGAMKETFGSTCHGAGRRMSRTKARKRITGADLHKELLQQGISIQTRSIRSLPEEAPYAYKDVEQVVDVVHSAGIAIKVARLRPLAVIKG